MSPNLLRHFVIILLNLSWGEMMTSTVGHGPLLQLRVLSVVGFAFWFAWVGSSDALAQSATSNYPVERFRLAADASGVLDVEWGGVPDHLSIDVGLWFGYADDPLNVYRTDGGDRVRAGSLVSRRLGGSLVGSIGLFDRFQIGVSVPLVLSQDQELNGVGMTGASLSSAGLGDVRLAPKVQLAGQSKAGVDVALTLGFKVPSSSSSDFMGDEGPVFQPEVAVSRRMGKLRTSLNVGYLLREESQALDLVVDDEVFAHVGAAYQIAQPVELAATFAFATGADDLFGAFNRNHAEVRGGVTYDVPGPVIVFAASGIGVAEGFGTPDWRAILGLRFQRGGDEEVADKPDRLVVAKSEPVDSDGDGIVDDKDKCPNEPENKNNYEDTDGCPEEIPDTDGDGLRDPDDECPTKPEDVDGFEDDNGCPDPDNDGDGIVDAEDKCRDEKGVVENRGCPDIDRDGDGVVDRLDNCPDEKGLPERQGCRKKQLVQITKTKIEILDVVYFRTNKAIIQRRSYRLLNNVAQVLKAHPEIEKIRVEGHTDSRGRDAYNKQLSQRRAESVVAYLVRKGVPRSRLESVGFGEEVPIDTNNTAAGRAANRRVDFKIVGAEGVKVERTGPTEDTID